MPWLLKMQAWDPAIPGLTTLYFSDIGIVSGPSDTPPHTYWKRRLDIPPSMFASAWGGTRIGGRSETGIGTATIANGDGALDGLAAMEFAGHAVEALYTTADRPTLGDFQTVLKAVAKFVVVGNDITLTVAERRDLIEKPWQPNRFAGTGGAEGGTDWADIRKPRAIGICWSVEADEIDEPNQVLCYGDTRVGGVLTARDQGVGLRQGPDYPDAAAMLAAAFGESDFLTCDALALVRLRTIPARPVTLDVAGWASATQLVANGAMTGGLTSWTAGTGWAGAANRAEKTAGTGSDLSQAIATEIGAWYALAATCQRSSASGVLAIKAGGSTLAADVFPDLRRVVVFQATATSTTIALSADAAWAGWVDDVSCRQVFARAGEIMREAILSDTPLEIADIETADIAALHTANGAALGHYTAAGEDRTVPAVLDDVCDTVGASWGMDPITGRFRVRRIEAPKVTADFTLTARDLDVVTPREVAHRLREMTIGTARRWRPLTPQEVAPGATDASRASLTIASYPTTAIHAPTATEALIWSDEKIESLFAYPAAGTAECARRCALWGPKRLAFDIETQDIPTLYVGDTLRIEDDRYGIDGGRNFVVLRGSREGLDRRLTASLLG